MKKVTEKVKEKHFKIKKIEKVMLLNNINKKLYRNHVTKLVIVIFILSSISCKYESKYNKDAWQSSDSGFPSENRDGMLNDLINHHKLKGQTVNQIMQLLGRPDQIENNLIVYNIVMKYGGDTDVEYTKKLKMTFSKDSIITSTAVIEWKRK